MGLASEVSRYNGEKHDRVKVYTHHHKVWTGRFQIPIAKSVGGAEAARAADFNPVAWMPVARRHLACTAQLSHNTYHKTSRPTVDISGLRDILLWCSHLCAIPIHSLPPPDRARCVAERRNLLLEVSEAYQRPTALVANSTCR